MFRYLTICVLSLALAALVQVPGACSEDDDFHKIKTAEKNQDADQVSRLSRDFCKKYPSGRRLTEVRFIAACGEKDPARALEAYRNLARGEATQQADLSQAKACELLYLLSRWKDLRNESAAAVKRFPQSPRADQYRLYWITANISLENYDEARSQCQGLIEKNHSPAVISRALVLLSQVDRKTTGFSRGYLNTLKDLAVGFNNSDIAPTVLFLLGEYYESKKKYSEAYSAFRDLGLKYPRSPESELAAGRMQDLKKRNPSIVPYLPSKKIIDDAENLDIQPEIDIQEEEGASYYSIQVGPLDNLKKARALKGLLKEFVPIRLVKTRRGYILFLSQRPDPDQSFEVKVRLAEEYGINGRIVRIVRNGQKEYIYGE